MPISRNEIRDAAKRARLNEVVYINGERITADEIGTTGKYIYTYAGHPGFTSVAALVKFIQAVDVADEKFRQAMADTEGPTTPPTKPDGAGVAIHLGDNGPIVDVGAETAEHGIYEMAVTPERVFGPKITLDGPAEGDRITEQNKRAIAGLVNEITLDGPAIGHAPPAIDFGERKAERRIRSHRRKLRRSGIIKGASIIGQ